MKDLARPLPAKGRVAGKVCRMGRLVLGIVSPLDVDCTPGEACAEGREDEVVTLLELLLELPDAEGGIVAELVLPRYSMLTITRSRGTCISRATASMIRRLAWWGTTQAMSS